MFSWGAACVARGGSCEREKASMGRAPGVGKSESKRAQVQLALVREWGKKKRSPKQNTEPGKEGSPAKTWLRGKAQKSQSPGAVMEEKCQKCPVQQEIRKKHGTQGVYGKSQRRLQGERMSNRVGIGRRASDALRYYGGRSNTRNHQCAMKIIAEIPSGKTSGKRKKNDTRVQLKCGNRQPHYPCQIKAGQSKK